MHSRTSDRDHHAADQLPLGAEPIRIDQHLRTEVYLQARSK